MKENSSKQLIIGLPATGKTTFLAALWHVVYEKEIQGALQLKELPELRDHLNKICEKWIDCYPIERTKVGFEKTVSMKLVDTKTSTEVEVFFPDMSGETFLNHLKDRQWSKDYDDFVREADGILLFVHPEKITEPILIDQVLPLIEELEPEAGNTIIGDTNEEAPWTVEKVPSQVLLVEILQFYVNNPHLYRIERVGVVISAWDLVMKHEQSPDEYLETRLPLLHQYIKANRDLFLAKSFGISAQGGDYNNVEQLRTKVRPIERIIVADGGSNPHDITAPVKWLMGL